MIFKTAVVLGLLPQVLCAGVATTLATTTTSSAKYEPTQPGIPSNCDKFHLVGPGDQCDTIEAQYGITDAQFKAWNPSINSGKSSYSAHVLLWLIPCPTHGSMHQSLAGLLCLCPCPRCHNDDYYEQAARTHGHSPRASYAWHRGQL